MEEYHKYWKSKRTGETREITGFLDEGKTIIITKDPDPGWRKNTRYVTEKILNKYYVPIKS